MLGFEEETEDLKTRGEVSSLEVFLEGAETSWSRVSAIVLFVLEEDWITTFERGSWASDVATKEAFWAGAGSKFLAITEF